MGVNGAPKEELWKERKTKCLEHVPGTIEVCLQGLDEESWKGWWKSQHLSIILGGRWVWASSYINIEVSFCSFLHIWRKCLQQGIEELWFPFLELSVFWAPGSHSLQSKRHISRTPPVLGRKGEHPFRGPFIPQLLTRTTEMKTHSPRILCKCLRKRDGPKDTVICAEARKLKLVGIAQREGDCTVQASRSRLNQTQSHFCLCFFLLTLDRL